MKYRNCTIEDLNAALKKVNEKYENNILFNRLDGNGKNFTLRVNSSSGPGAGRSVAGRKLTSACWHVHGDFFDALFEINPEAVIISGYLPKDRNKINADGGNWQDIERGSLLYPCYASELCECE